MKMILFHELQFEKSIMTIFLSPSSVIMKFIGIFFKSQSQDTSMDSNVYSLSAHHTKLKARGLGTAHSDNTFHSVCVILLQH